MRYFVLKRATVLLVFSGFFSGLANADPILSTSLGKDPVAIQGTSHLQRYGILNIQKVILTVKEGASARAELEKFIQSRQQELGKQQQELDKLNQEWQDQSALLTGEAKQKKQQEFQKKFMDLRGAQENFNAEVQQRNQGATQKIAIKAAGIAEEIAKKSNLEVIFEANTAGLVYVQNPKDVTDAVILQYSEYEKKGWPTAFKELESNVIGPIGQKAPVGQQQGLNLQ